MLQIMKKFASSVYGAAKNALRKAFEVVSWPFRKVLSLTGKGIDMVGSVIPGGKYLKRGISLGIGTALLTYLFVAVYVAAMYGGGMLLAMLVLTPANALQNLVFWLPALIVTSWMFSAIKTVEERAKTVPEPRHGVLARN